MARKVRIAILWESFPGYLVKCIKILATNYNVEILAACRSQDTTKNTKEDLVGIENIKIIDFTNYIGEKEKQAIDQVLEFKPDLAIITVKKFSILSHTARILKNKNIPVVGASDQYWHNSPRDFINWLLAKIGYFKFHYDLFWVPGVWGRNYARKLGFKNNQIIEGVYSADSDLFYDAYKKRLKDNSWPKSFLFVGQYISRKGLINLLRAYQIYRQGAKNPWPLWCVGQGELKPLLKNKVGVKDWGLKSSKEISQIMSQSGCLILPSKIDHWGVVIHEASCAGLPIIASNSCGATASLVRQNFNGYLFSANNIGQLASLLKKMTQEKRWLNFSRSSYKLSKKYSPKLWADKIMKEMPKALKIKQ